jgi:hypothetical protein
MMLEYNIVKQMLTDRERLSKQIPEVTVSTIEWHPSLGKSKVVPVLN